VIQKLRHGLVRTYDVFVTLISLAFFGVAGLAYGIISLPLSFVLSARWGEPLGKYVLQKLFVMYLTSLRLTGRVKVDVSGLDELNQRKGLILAPNHPGLIDAVLVMSRVRDVTCVAKASLWKNPVLVGGLRLSRFIPNHSHAYMIREGVETLRKGSHLLLFPEGTRTVRPPINELRGIVAIVQKKAEAPVQTILLEYVGPDGKVKDFMGKNQRILHDPGLPVTLRARLGKVFMREEGEDSRDFLRRLESYYHAELTGTVPES
jgi:1-acyl-sn-glycerol-3-phosphate acyltransferase